MVSFIHNGSEITAWMGHSFKNQKHKIQSNIFKIASFQAADHYMTIITLGLYTNSLKQLFL